MGASKLKPCHVFWMSFDSCFSRRVNACQKSLAVAHDLFDFTSKSKRRTTTTPRFQPERLPPHLHTHPHHGPPTYFFIAGTVIVSIVHTFPPFVCFNAEYLAPCDELTVLPNVVSASFSVITVFRYFCSEMVPVQSCWHSVPVP